MLGGGVAGTVAVTRRADPGVFDDLGDLGGDLVAGSAGVAAGQGVGQHGQLRGWPWPGSGRSRGSGRCAGSAEWVSTTRRRRRDAATVLQRGHAGEPVGRPRRWSVGGRAGQQVRAVRRWASTRRTPARPSVRCAKLALSSARRRTPPSSRPGLGEARGPRRLGRGRPSRRRGQRGVPRDQQVDHGGELGDVGPVAGVGVRDQWDRHRRG